MIGYIKSFKDYIPTWIICIFMFFGIFGWTFIVGLVLLVIQCFQRKKIKKSINTLKDYIENSENDFSVCSDESYKLHISTLKQELENDQKKIIELKNQLYNEQNIAKENENLKVQISKLENEIICLRENLENDTSKLEKFESTKKFVLTAGKYKGGTDIPVGCYNVTLISGGGVLETDTPDDLYFRMTLVKSKQAENGWIESYKNLDISEKTVLKISESANIEFSISRKYDFSQELEEIKSDFNSQKTKYERELLSIKEEINILNSQLIKNYYNFSDYKKITSEECKNNLVILKQKEKELRENNLDVKVFGVATINSKTQERCIRQILRTFNAECDNIMLNVGLKNIDSCRNKIQSSFESANKLYSIDGAALTKDLLKLKLEQITLMYTYELKYQQEKEIQKAIKEKMVEEAKAQREIEEQKKKIDKDLQQHLGEVNRLTKYLEKIQSDVEKEVYIDRIKKLEEKIKLLESDKETVLEREANAKAGFVYIISNIGSFGENIYKIGMTRRLEPMDRIKELSSASVPFEFDVHAMIFSSDAPELENTLHKYFANKAVNKINPRKEFYKVNIDEIEKVVKENYNDTVQFTKIPVATEYRQSLNFTK